MRAQHNYYKNKYFNVCSFQSNFKTTTEKYSALPIYNVVGTKNSQGQGKSIIFHKGTENCKRFKKWANYTLIKVRNTNTYHNSVFNN